MPDTPRPHRVLWCTIRGHKFWIRSILAERYERTDFCTRCGMRPWELGRPERKPTQTHPYPDR